MDGFYWGEGWSISQLPIQFNGKVFITLTAVKLHLKENIFNYMNKYIKKNKLCDSNCSKNVIILLVF